MTTSKNTTKGKGAKAPVSPRRPAGKTWGDVTMYPFEFGTERWLDHAQMLAAAAGTYEAGSEQNAAVIQLITGIAATENEDDRMTIAYFAAERIFSQTQESISALDSLIRRTKGATLRGTV